MPNNSETFKIPTPRRELPLSIFLGASFALVLFVLMALAQMIGEVAVPDSSIDEMVMAFTAPDIAEMEEEEPPPPEEEEPPPELDEAPPELSLAQLDLALNTGTGESLVGEFSMPLINTSAASLGTEDFVDFSELDQMPRPASGTQLKFPRRLKRKKASGTIVILLQLSETGEVLNVELEKSNLPEFNDVVLAQVADWNFTAPTKEGRPVKAQAKLPIPIKIN